MNFNMSDPTPERPYSDILGEEWKKMDIPRFSDVSKQELEKLGFRIYELKGRTIHDLVRDGMRFATSWQNDEQSLLSLPSHRTEVAIFPTDPYMPRSSDKTFEIHRGMLVSYRKQLSKKITLPGSALMIGGVTDYIELALEHLKATHFKLFGKENGYRFATTETTDGSRIVIVGQYREEGLTLDRILQEKHYKGVWCTPLIVPFSPSDPSVISEDIVSIN